MRQTKSTNLVLAEAARRLWPDTRRMFLQRALGLGTLALLAGCDVVDGDSAEQALNAMSDFNDRVQAWLFSEHRLAREYTQAEITRPFPFNATYPREQSPVVDGESYRLEISGMVTDTAPWTLAQLHSLPAFSQITRHVCIEGWSAVGQWRGPQLSELLRRVGTDTKAHYVTFRCADGYVTSIDMPTARHPQTQLSLWSDGAVLPREHGFPLKLRVPTKLGFKNAKHIVAIDVGREDTGGTWETYGYNRYSGL